MNYETFLAQKRLVAPVAGFDVDNVSEKLFPFQRDLVRWALRKGRAAIWADCGLGKSPMALEWGRAVCEHMIGRAHILILTPLAVARQFQREGEKFGVPVTVCREPEDVRPGVNVTNYERMHKFDLSIFDGIVLDESSCLKDYTSKTRNLVIDSFASTPYRLALTATPAPNDHVELGNHAEFLGVMSRVEMLSTFFVHDGGSTQDWRLKGHARKDFWRWVCTWAASVRLPSDLGYSDDGYVLPPLDVHEHIVAMPPDYHKTQGSLFIVDASGLSEQREARRASLTDRVQAAAAIVNAEPGEQWIVWTELNDESAQVAALISDAVEITGSDSAETKETAMERFVSGETRVIVSKSSIFGMGLNLQNCARNVYVGVTHSFESWYQSIRRTYRFGQRRPVHAHVIVSEAERGVLANLKRKQADAMAMGASMAAEVGEFVRADLAGSKRDFVNYEPKREMTIPAWVGQEGP